MTHKKLLFTEDAFINGELVYKKGEIYDIAVESGSYSRWIKRGVAKPVGNVAEIWNVAEIGEGVLEESAPAIVPEVKEIPQEIAKPKTKKENKKNSNAIKEL
jgi:hypothetical protein